MNYIVSPFITSSEVLIDEDFFDREDVINAVDKFIRRNQDINFLIFGQRRIGKTSVLKRILKLYSNNNFKSLFYTLQGEAETTLENLLKNIATRICNDFGFEIPYIQEIDSKNFLTDFLPDLKKILKKNTLILLFDEFDVMGQRENIIELQKTISYHKFIDYIPQIIDTVKNNSIPIKLIFAIGRNYKDLDNERFGQINKFGQQIEISTFPQEIINKMLEQTDNICKFTEKAKKRIYEITSGHPYFTQCLAALSFDHAVDTNQKEISLKIVDSVLIETIKRYSSGVLWIWDTLTNTDKIILYLAANLIHNNKKIDITNLKQSVHENNFLPVVDQLYNSLSTLTNIKFLIYEKNEYKFFSEFFRNWIITEINLSDLQKYFFNYDLQISNLLINAKFSFNENNFDEALLFFQKILNVAPSHFDALFYSAKIFTKKNNYKEAYNLFKRAFSINPNVEKQDYIFVIEQLIKEYSKTEKDFSNLETELYIYDTTRDSEVFIIKQLERKYDIEIINISLDAIFNNILLEKKSLDAYSTDDKGFITGLRLIDFDKNDLYFLGNLKNIIILELLNCQLPDDIYNIKLENLLKIKLRNLFFSDISFLSSSKKISFIDLSYNTINDLNPIKYLTEITNLSLCYNLINNISVLENLVNIKYLDLRDNQIKDITALKSLTNITHLDLANNQIYDISALESLINLTYLDLSNNNIKDISVLKNFTKLRQLNLSNNQINEISVLNYLPELKTITHLNLEKNQITDISILINFTHLTNLKLGLNKVENISYLQNLKKLTDLDLNNNLIEDFSVIKDLKHIKKIDLSNNKIRKFPQWVVDLNCQILWDKSVFFFFNKSDFINFFENPIENIPIEILKQGVNAIKNYFIDFESGDDNLFEAKLLILGEPGSGKTTLARKILNQNAEMPLEEETTRGVDVFRWNCEINTKNLKNQPLQVNIWDFGGQSIYKSTHRFFLSHRALYILLTDGRKEDTDFNYWLNIQEMFGGKSPIIIVMNEREKREYPLPMNTLKGRFLNLKEKYNINLKEVDYKYDILKNAILHYISELPHIGSKVPKSWKLIREDLEKLSEKYINREKYFEICRNHNITETEKMLQLSQFFHDIGVFLHFQDDAVLKNIIFLDNDWALNAAYNILDTESIKKKEGQFLQSDVEIIWGKSQYSFIYDELLALMKRFYLIYEVPETKKFVAPQLLPEDSPNYKWDTDNNLQLRYEYDNFMPQGIIWQFISTMHEYIKSQTEVWRNGVLLMKNNTEAEITEVYGKHKISIRIKGKHKSELRTIIAHELDKINNQYTHLSYDKLVPCVCEECNISTEPYFHKYSELIKLNEKGIGTSQCKISGYSVNIVNLLEGIENTEVQVSDKNPPSSKIKKSSTKYRLKNIYNLIDKSFNDTNLYSFCMYNFEDVYEKFADGQSKTMKINILIDYCKRKMKIEELLNAMQDENIEQFEINKPYYT